MHLFSRKNPGAGPGSFNRGFSLLELIIVLVLIGLLLVVSVPTLRNSLIDDPLRSSGRKMIGYISGVRDKAVREQQPYLLYIDLDGNRLWYLREADVKKEEVEPPEKGLLQLDDSVKLRDVWMKATGTANRGVAEIWVSKQGYLDQTVIHLGNRDGEEVSLRVFSFLPDIKVLDGHYDPE